MSQKIYEIQLTQEEYDLLFTGLRYLELSYPDVTFPRKDNYRPQFRKLLTKITMNLKQLGFF